jgi:sugar phosphate isomerase/epimerase
MTRRLKLGFDNYSIRALDWKAPQLLKYAASHQLDTVLFSDLNVYESLSDGYLRDIKSMADDLGIEIQAGTGGICKTSGFWNGKWGPPEKLLKTTIRVAKTLKSPVARCYLGWIGDRSTHGGIRTHMKAVVQTCRKLRSYALDSGVRIAVENHAGDMQSQELVSLIHEAGPEFMGATLDTGNAVWTMEDPAATTIETLGRYAVSTGIRDSAVWETKNGAAFEWKAMGDGQVDWKTFFKKYEKLCPRTPVQLEIITGPARELPYHRPDYWKPWREAPAEGFLRYASFARRGKAPKPYQAKKGLQAEQAWQLTALEKSITYCKKVLGLGLKK